MRFLTTLFLSALLVLTLQGCASAKLTNRLAVAEACDKMIVASWWQYFGISVDIDPADAEERLERCREDKALRAKAVKNAAQPTK